jgi:uncharacterized delta-60 repeat protein
MRLLACAAIMAIALAGPISSSPGSSAGELDPAFSGDGKVKTTFGFADDVAHGVAVQPNGMIVVVGAASNGTDHDFGVARYGSTGDLDSTFGGDGKVTTDFGSGEAIAKDVAIQSNGRIVVAGYLNSPSGWEVALARYRSDGRLDRSFGGDGRVTTSVGDGGRASGVAIDANGRIVVGGTASIGSDEGFVAARFNRDGSLDTTFSGDGWVVTGFDNGLVYDSGHDVAVQPDARVVVVGQAYEGGDYDFGLLRYLSDGTLDQSFGVGGKVVTNGTAAAHGVAIDSDGKIVAAGDGDGFAVVRYQTNGSPDKAFGVGGIAVADFGSGQHYVRGVALQQDGTILAAGSIPTLEDFVFALVRFTGAGDLDPGFGDGGLVTTDLFRGDDFGNAGAVQADGNIVMAGCTKCDEGFPEFALARYVG